MPNKELPVRNHLRGLYTLSPLVVFFLLYVISGIATDSFYAVPVTVTFLTASLWAIISSRPAPFARRIERFSRGAANPNIMMMIWIFILAGAFAKGASYIGAVDSTVNFTLSLLPSNMLLPGMFLAACIISFSIGTSVGTIAALIPVAAALADKSGLSLALMAGSVVGGAFFGDNLSFISDTTIAATRTQGCAMKDKFRANFRIVLPAALLALVLYVILGLRNSAVAEPGAIDGWLMLPYLLVLVPALLGVNVVRVLLLGILGSGVLVCFYGNLSLMLWAKALGEGISGMGELIVVTLLAGGMLELIRYNGGLTYLIGLISRRLETRRGAELSIGLMVAFSNICTANNTVAIVAVGDISRRLALRFNVPPARVASVLDTFSCVVQGLLPYGAQLLMAGALVSLPAMQIIPWLFYNFILGAVALAFIIVRPWIARLKSDCNQA